MTSEKIIFKSYDYGFTMVECENKPHLGGNFIGNSNLGIKYNGDINSIAIEMWKYLIEKYDIKNVLDVGCGCGYASEVFVSLGCEVTAFDGLEFNVKNSNSVLNCFVHDITEKPYISEKLFDLVWCCEVAEHIEEKYLDNYVRTLKNGKLIAMTAACPGDGGHHHVNCQYSDYWIKHITESKDYVYDPVETKECRERTLALDSKWEPHFKRNGLIFKKV